MSDEPVDILITDDSISATPLAGVTVRVYSEDGATAITQSTTDSDGNVGFLLPSDLTYQLRLYKFGIGFTNPKYIEVLAAPETNSFSLTGTNVTPPISSDNRLCMAYGFFRDITGAPAMNVDLNFTSVFRPLLLDGSAVITERVTARTDVHGYAQLPLIRLGLYKVILSGFADYERVVAIPDLPSINLPDLLFPVVTRITFSPDFPTTMALEDGDVEITPTLLCSDGLVVPDSGASDVQWSSSDTNVLAVLPSAGVLTLRPLSAGTAEVRAVRQDASIIRIPEPGILGVPLTVVVS